MIKYISPFFIFFIFLTSCESNSLEVDTTDVVVDINYHRLDTDLFKSNSVKELEQVNKKFIEYGGELYEFYTIEMLRVGSPFDDSIAVFLNYFIQDSMMQLVNENVNTKFKDFSAEQNQITEMFKHLKYHIPHAMMPTDIIVYNSTFANGVVSTPTKMGLGLEMYLGMENKVIQKLPYPEYFKVKMSSDYLLADIAQSWVVSNVIEDQSGEDFLSNMLYYGKVLYLVDAMMPMYDSHTKLRYTSLEYEWAEVSEFDIWQHIVEQNWIYSNDIKLIVRYFNESPTTVGLEGSPARIGQFLGWRIIKSYMDKNPDVTILELIAEDNQSKILKSYKPKDIK
jgi:hypothetical protein